MSKSDTKTLLLSILIFLGDLSLNLDGDGEIFNYQDF